MSLEELLHPCAELPRRVRERHPRRIVEDDGLVARAAEAGHDGSEVARRPVDAVDEEHGSAAVVIWSRQQQRGPVIAKEIGCAPDAQLYVPTVEEVGAVVHD